MWKGPCARTCPESCPLHTFEFVCCSSRFYTVAGKITSLDTMFNLMQAKAGNCHLLLLSHQTDVTMACHSQLVLNQTHIQRTAQIISVRCKAVHKKGSRPRACNTVLNGLVSLRTSPSISLQLQFASKRHAQALSTLHQILQMLRQKQITPRRQHFCHQWNQHSECRAGPMPESLMAGDGVREMLRHYSLRAVMLLASASPGPWCW